MKTSDIPAEEGMAGVIDGTPVAVYNNGKGLLVLRNVCTHMGCQTGWNAFEQTWDCPCHGSRYHPDGSVLRGPATGPLPGLKFHLEQDEIVLEPSG